MLEIRDLSVEVEGKEILRNIDLTIADGEVMVMFGPNGSGKSTLVRAIMGYSGYRVKTGEILYNGKNAGSLSIEEKARAGIGVMYQHPPAIRGVRLNQIARYMSDDDERIKTLAGKLSLKGHLDRDINLAYSGGEMKRSELFQVLVQDCRTLLLDEPESGVDIENVALMGRVLNDHLKESARSSLIITHTGYILDYVEAARACVLLEGTIWCDGRSPKEVFKSIREEGYSKCKECQDRTTS
ncbi:MAG: ATP-binding cassette domain-containing protein [Candidatus Omnitrophica bacterium]|nr:ATP-binding cassette domain-containing protein [Candidatus Omnitrophota bacterium]